MTMVFTIFQGLGPPRFQDDMLANEEIALRYIHITGGIIWIGLLYFLNLVGTPTLKELDPAVRSKVFPVLMRRAMWWFRWSSLVTVLAGIRYFWQMLYVDAVNDGKAIMAWRWFGEWFAVWLVAYALIYPLQMPRKGLFDNPWVRTIGIGSIVFLATCAVLELNANAPVEDAAKVAQYTRPMTVLYIAKPK